MSRFDPRVRRTPRIGGERLERKDSPVDSYRIFPQDPRYRNRRLKCSARVLGPRTTPNEAVSLRLRPALSRARDRSGFRLRVSLVYIPFVQRSFRLGRPRKEASGNPVAAAKFCSPTRFHIPAQLKNRTRNDAFREMGGKKIFSTVRRWYRENL